MEKILLVVVFVAVAAPADAFLFPPKHRQPKCHRVFETVSKTECSVAHVQKCASVPTTTYETKYEKVCVPVTEKKCEQVFKDVPDKQCTTVPEKKCVDEKQTVYETSFTKSCTSVPSEVCTGGYGRKRRSAEPSHGYGPVHGPVAYGPVTRCQTVHREICEQVPVQTAKTVTVPVCTAVPKTTCVDTTRKVADLKCEDVKKESCSQVAKQVPKTTTVEKCTSVPEKRCAHVPVKVPRKVCEGH